MLAASGCALPWHKCHANALKLEIALLSWQDMSKEAQQAKGCACALKVQLYCWRGPSALATVRGERLHTQSFHCCWLQEMKEAKVADRDGDEASWRRHFVRAMNHMAGKDAAGGTGRETSAAGELRSMAGRSEGAASFVSK